jgi:hypothetical protein
MSKTDDQIRSEISLNESRAEWGAWSVVGGLVLEILFATARSLGFEIKPAVENWGGVIADCLIALGVYSEIHFGRKASSGNVELRRRSEERVAEANVNAAQAHVRANELALELEKERQKRAPRRLTEQQIAEIKTLRGRVEKIQMMVAKNIETILFANQITMALAAAGIAVERLEPFGAEWSGIAIASYPPREKEPLYEVFARAQLLDSWIYLNGLTTQAGTLIEGPLLMIGEPMPERTGLYFGIYRAPGESSI